MNKKKLGILGGMGPRSTAPFLEQVLDECQAQYDARLDEDFPHIIIYSLPTPFYLDQPIDHELMQKTIIEGLKELEKNGVDCIAMPCNSAHIYMNNLGKSIDTELLNMIEETLSYLPKAPHKITLLATKTTFEAEIYQAEIIKQGHQFIFHNSWQLKINNLIQSIKIDKNNPDNLVLWQELFQEVDQQVDFIIIACTDLNVVINKNKENQKILDSSKCLAHSFIEYYLK